MTAAGLCPRRASRSCSTSGATGSSRKTLPVAYRRAGGCRTILHQPARHRRRLPSQPSQPGASSVTPTARSSHLSLLAGPCRRIWPPLPLWLPLASSRPPPLPLRRLLTRPLQLPLPGPQPLPRCDLAVSAAFVRVVASARSGARSRRLGARSLSLGGHSRSPRPRRDPLLLRRSRLWLLTGAHRMTDLALWRPPFRKRPPLQLQLRRPRLLWQYRLQSSKTSPSFRRTRCTPQPSAPG